MSKQHYLLGFVGNTKVDVILENEKGDKEFYTGITFSDLENTIVNGDYKLLVKVQDDYYVEAKLHKSKYRKKYLYKLQFDDNIDDIICSSDQIFPIGVLYDDVCVCDLNIGDNVNYKHDYLIKITSIEQIKHKEKFVYWFKICNQYPYYQLNNGVMVYGGV